MDLTDILFSKPFIGSSGGGGGGSNVETATIVITVTDGTPKITSGEFPDWCNEANADDLYGKVAIQDVYVSDEMLYGEGYRYISIARTSLDESGSIVLAFYDDDSGNMIGVAANLSIVSASKPITSGTLTITLIYMPEE